MEAFLLLSASLVPLLLGPLVARKAEASTFFALALDRFVTLAVGGSMVLHVLPEAYHGAGGWSLPAAAAGFLLPFGIHRWWHHRNGDSRGHLFWLAFLGLALHAALDGVALFAPLAHRVEEVGHHHASVTGTALALAVILHRLPMALAIWWLARPVLGQRSAIRLLGGIALATVVGFLFAGPLWRSLPEVGIALFEAMVAGMLLHIVIDHHGPTLSDNTGVSRRATLTGGVAGLVVVGLVSLLTPIGELDERFWLKAVVMIFLLWLAGRLWRGRRPGLLGGGDPFEATSPHTHHPANLHAHDHLEPPPDQPRESPGP